MQEVNLHKLLPTLVLTNRFKGSGFTFSTQFFTWVPLQTLFDFSQFFCFFIITLVSEIVKEKLCIHLHLKICRYSAMKPSGRPKVATTVIRQFVIPQNRFARCFLYFVLVFSSV